MRSSPFVSAVTVALSLARIISALQVVGPISNLQVGNAVVNPDGVPRSAIVVNGQFPGPLITGQPFSQYKLTVQDQLTDDTMLTPTSIHWHGLFQKNTSFADGTAFVSQCPITPGNQFTYAFNSRGQAGTYWYHSHYSVQYCDGLRGPFVVYDPNDPMQHLYDVDTQDTVITLADWYHKPALQHGFTDIADSTLINGLGRSWVNTTASPLAVVNVSRNIRYRFRIVSLSCDPAFEFSIDNHTMTIIEVDGNTHQPLSVDQLTIFAGQRYSVVVIANQPIGNYWIRAKPIQDLTQLPDFFAGGINSAIFRYAGAPKVEPKTVQTGGKNPLVEARLQPFSNPAAPGTPDVNAADVVKLNMNFNLNFTDLTFNLNGVRTTLPSVPILLQILSGAKAAQDLVGASNVFTLPKNAVVQLSLPAAPSAPVTGHPIHLHGHSFSVIRSAGQTDYNFNNPPRRDVVSLGAPGDNVTIRFNTDNAGPWFLHCHVDFHLAAGFAAVFAEDPADIKQSLSAGNGIPSSFNKLCSAFDDFSANSGRPAPVSL